MQYQSIHLTEQVSISFCCVTNHLKALWLKSTQVFMIFHKSMLAGQCLWSGLAEIISEVSCGWLGLNGLGWSLIGWSLRLGSWLSISWVNDQAMYLSPSCRLAWAYSPGDGPSFPRAMRRGKLQCTSSFKA